MRISWITFSHVETRPDGALGSPLASLRYRVLAPMHGLTGGPHTHALFTVRDDWPPPAFAEVLDADLLVFSKSVSVANEELASRAKALRVPIVFDVCDDFYEDARLGAHYRRMTALADRVVCNTQPMAASAQPFSRTTPVVIEDPYEAPLGTPRYAPGDWLNLLWFGFPSNLDSLHAVLPELAGYSESRPLTLTILTALNPQLEAVCAQATAAYGAHFRMQAKPWSLEAQWAELEACDAVLIPSLPAAIKQAKSANRMIEALRAGRPVVAQPLPAYQPFAEWTPVGASVAEGLAWLDAHRAEIPERIAAAQAYIEARYAPAVIGRQWSDVVHSVRSTPAPSEPAPDMAEPARAYLQWLYDSHAWKQVSYRGVRTLKLPSDMWNYQEILTHHRIDWVIETGSRHGGSALYFADLLRNLGRAGKVVSIDLMPELDPRAEADDRIDFITADSAAPAIVAEVLGRLPADRGSLFLILDSDHSAAHVRRELDAWVPGLRPGDYLVVEDTIVNGHPVRPDHGPGPMEAIRDFLAANPGMLIHDASREAKFGATFAAAGYYLKA